jgi:hypothetical protein
MEWFLLVFACEDGDDFYAYVRGDDRDHALANGYELRPRKNYLVEAFSLDDAARLSGVERIDPPPVKWLHRLLSREDTAELDREMELLA